MRRAEGAVTVEIGHAPCSSEKMPTVLEAAETRVATQQRQRSLVWRLARALLRIALGIAVVACLWGGWYLAKRGFGQQWRSLVVEELHKRGVEASVGRLTLDPFRGLVAKNVRIFDYQNRDITLALISEISLDINYAALIHHESFLNALDVRNAQITLPLRTAEGRTEKVQLNNFRAHVYFPPEQIYVSQAEGIFCGIRISASGQLIKRENYKPSPPIPEEEWRRRVAMVRWVGGAWEKFNLPATPPSLQVKFSGDVAEIENARVEATLRGDRLQRGNYEIRNLFVASEWKDQHLDVTQCEWSDQLGSFAGRADWNQQSNRAKFQMHSSLDLRVFLDAFELSGPLADVTFDSPPLVDVSGSLNFEANRLRPEVIGHAAFGQFTYKTVPFSDLAADFSWNGERTLLRDLRLRHQTGQLRADLFEAPGDFRLNVESTMAPSAFRAISSPGLDEFLRQWEWQRSPTVRLAIRGEDRNPENWRGDGTIALDRARFRGVWMNSASAKIRFADGAVTCEDFRVVRDEGAGTGTFTYDFKKHEVRIANVKSLLNPAEAIFWIDPKLWKTVLPYKFRRPPTVTTNGVYQFRGGKNTRLEIKVDGANGMDYVFLGKTLPFDRVAGRLLFTNDRLQITDLRGGLLAGTLHGKADISLARNDPG